MTLPIAADAVGGVAGAARSTAARRSVTQRTGVTPTNPPPVDTAAARPPTSARTGTGSPSTSSPAKRRPLSIPTFSGLKGAGGGAHKLVIAEFVLCVVLIGIAPILVRPPAPDGQGRDHLYLANDFIRLSATCLLFFILALLSNQPKSARFAAAFGGLVVLGAAFNANKAFVALTGVFTTPKKAAP